MLISNSHFPYIFNGLHQCVEHRVHLEFKKNAKVVLLNDQKPYRDFKEATERNNALDKPDNAHRKVNSSQCNLRCVGCANQLLIKLLHLAQHDEADPKV